MAKVTLIKRSEPRCPSCQMMAQALDAEGIKYETIDISTQPEAVEEYGISAIPVVLIDVEGRDKVRLNGFRPVDEIKELID